MIQILYVNAGFPRTEEIVFRREDEAPTCASFGRYYREAIEYKRMASSILMHAEGCVECSFDTHL